MQALHYDVPRGTTSVGIHVRDAACYVCWAFARAFDAEVMAPHVAALAPALLVQVVFDREVNCRRVAMGARSVWGSALELVAGGAASGSPQRMGQRMGARGG